MQEKAEGKGAFVVLVLEVSVRLVEESIYAEGSPRIVTCLDCFPKMPVELREPSGDPAQGLRYAGVCVNAPCQEYW